MMENILMKKKITKALNDSDKPRGLSLQELSTITGLSRNTICKYISILEARDEVTLDKVGNSKLVYLNKTISKLKENRME